jgi:hypothetical protein
LGHIWLHRHEHVIVGRIFAGDDPRAIEKQANTFAAEFLMPEEAIKRAIAFLQMDSPLTAEDVVCLQRTFGVSYKAMLVRLRHLRMIKQEHFERLERENPVRLALKLGYEVDGSEVGESREPPFYEQLPRGYVDLVLRAWGEDLIGEGKAAQLLGTDRYSLSEFVRMLEEDMRRQQAEDIPSEIGG